MTRKPAPSSFHPSTRFPPGRPRIITAWIYIIGDDLRPIDRPESGSISILSPANVHFFCAEDVRSQGNAFVHREILPIRLLVVLHDAPNCPGTSHGRARRACERGKRKKLLLRGGKYIFARVVHQWDGETNCIFRRVRSVNTVSSSKRTELPPPVLYARNVCVAKGSQRGEGCSSSPSTLPIRSQRG